MENEQSFNQNRNNQTKQTQQTQSHPNHGSRTGEPGTVKRDEAARPAQTGTGAPREQGENRGNFGKGSQTGGQTGGQRGQGGQRLNPREDDPIR